MSDFDGSLDDLLSDGDSFFENPKKLAKKLTPKKTAKAAADIFGFDKETQPENTATKKEDDWLGLGDDKPIQKPAPIVSTRKVDDKLSFDRGDDFGLGGLERKTSGKKADKLNFDDDDINDILGIGSTDTKPTKKTDIKDDAVKIIVPPRSAAAKKSSILDDILGDTKKEEKSLSFDDILQSSSIRKKETQVPSVSSEIKITVTPAQTQNEFKPTIGRESRRGRRNSQGIIDPLGIFDSAKVDTSIKEDKQKETKKADTSISTSGIEVKKISDIPNPRQVSRSEPVISAKNVDLPNWLGVTESKSKQEKEQNKALPEPKPDEPTTKIQVQNIPIYSETTEANKIPDNMLESILTQQKISSSHIELQNASLALQQQESQLMVAVQLRKYEDSLAEMQRKQQEMILKQDVQFNSLLERQFAKQHVMENNMRLQQERINNHIQILLSQPSNSPSVGISSEEQQRKHEYIKNSFEENRKFYDDIIGSLKQKHNEEIFLLEESYKKQLSFLENSLESTEQRLKAEIENINKHYIEKIENIMKEKENLIKQYDEKIKQINEQNLSEIDSIKENCKITISDVRNEYKQMIEDISKSKTKEQEILTETGQITKKIEESLGVLNNNTQTISEIQTKFQQDRQILSDIKHETLSVKEQEIKIIQSSLDKQRADTDAERAQLLVLVRTLETRVAEQTQATREERWALQQATAILVARSAAIDREAEYSKKNIEREREQTKTLRENLLSEQETIMLQLTEHKLAIAAEKSRLETSVKLAQNFDNSKIKAEVEAAVKIAKEATELTDKERENLCKQQCEIEILKRTLQDRESKLNAKENELEKLFRIADQKYRDGEKALTEAKLTEHKYNERLKEIQKQLVSLAGREKKLTEEKISLSKERLSLHTQMKDKKCGLCEADNNDYNTDFRNVPNFAENERPAAWGTDAEILRIKYDLENENVVSKEQSIIDSET